MKRIYSILFASFSLLSWTSCSSYLEENPKDRLDEEAAYSTLSDVQKNGVLSLYNYVGGYVDSQGLQGTGRGIYDLNTFTTDEAIMPTRGGDWYDGGFWQGLYLHRWGVNNEAIYATWEMLPPSRSTRSSPPSVIPRQIPQYSCLGANTLTCRQHYQPKLQFS